MDAFTPDRFLSLLSCVQLWHWQAEKYAEHQAWGFCYAELAPLFDRFIETYQGTDPQVRLERDNLYVVDLPYVDAKDYLKDFCGWFGGLGMSSSLSNIRDEIGATLGKTLYLLSLS